MVLEHSGQQKGDAGILRKSFPAGPWGTQQLMAGGGGGSQCPPQTVRGIWWVPPDVKKTVSLEKGRIRLGGGNIHILYFHPENWGRWIHFDDHIFQMGWLNHQLWCLSYSLTFFQSHTGTLVRVESILLQGWGIIVSVLSKELPLPIHDSWCYTCCESVKICWLIKATNDGMTWKKNKPIQRKDVKTDTGTLFLFS